MKLIQSSELKVGMVLGEDIIGENGELIIANGITLTKKQTQNIKKLKIPYLCVLNGDNKDKTRNKDVQLEKVYYKVLLTVQSVFDNARIRNRIEIDKVKQAIDPIFQEIIKDSNMFCKIRKIDVLDEYTYSHSINVGILATITGKWLGLPVEELKELAIAGLLHDIGKAMIPIEILNKPGVLNDEEFEMIKKHALKGYDYLRNIPHISKDILSGILQHHERMDGSGYPFKLKGSDIHKYAKIISIVDTFDAIISKRSYKPRKLPLDAIAVLYSNLFHSLDPYICTVFLDNIIPLYIGNTVKLNSNEVGKIITINKYSPTKPLIKVNDKFIDLSKDNAYKIVDLIL